MYIKANEIQTRRSKLFRSCPGHDALHAQQVATYSHQTEVWMANEVALHCTLGALLQVTNSCWVGTIA